MSEPLVRHVVFERRGDHQGWLVAMEGGRNVPFEIRRAYTIFGTRPGVRRGNHAHRRLHQLMICVSGSCIVTLDDGTRREDTPMRVDDRGLLLDPMIWHEMHAFSPDCVLLVLADAWYDERDYIRDYGEFKAACRN